MTNYERVKQMSLEEMVDFINHETDGISHCRSNDNPGYIIITGGQHCGK